MGNKNLSNFQAEEQVWGVFPSVMRSLFQKDIATDNLKLN